MQNISLYGQLRVDNELMADNQTINFETADHIFVSKFCFLISEGKKPIWIDSLSAFITINKMKIFVSLFLSAPAVI